MSATREIDMNRILCAAPSPILQLVLKPKYSLCINNYQGSMPIDRDYAENFAHHISYIKIFLNRNGTDSFPFDKYGVNFAHALFRYTLDLDISNPDVDLILEALKKYDYLDRVIDTIYPLIWHLAPHISHKHTVALSSIATKISSQKLRALIMTHFVEDLDETQCLIPSDPLLFVAQLRLSALPENIVMPPVAAFLSSLLYNTSSKCAEQEFDGIRFIIHPEIISRIVASNMNLNTDLTAKIKNLPDAILTIYYLLYTHFLGKVDDLQERSILPVPTSIPSTKNLSLVTSIIPHFNASISAEKIVAAWNKYHPNLQLDLSMIQ